MNGMAKRSPRKTFLLLCPLALLALLCLSGCVYFRLFQLKNQLRDVDRYFSLSGDRDLVVRFNEPVLFAQDLRFLIGAPPLQRSMEGEERAWHFEFEMVRHTPLAEPTPLERLTLDMGFNNGYKLVRLTIPETFLMFFPRNMFLETVKQAAYADILELKKTVRGHVKLSPEADKELTARFKAEEFLGPPLGVRKEADGTETLIYRYRILSADRPIPIIVRLGYERSGRLCRVYITWDTASLDVKYLKPG